MKYKVGQKVKCLDGRGWSGNFKTSVKYDVLGSSDTSVLLLDENGIKRTIVSELYCDFEPVEDEKIDIRFDVQKKLLKNHNFRYDSYMETRDQIIEAEFEKRRVLTKAIYDELDIEERFKIGI